MGDGSKNQVEVKGRKKFRPDSDQFEFEQLQNSSSMTSAFSLPLPVPARPWSGNGWQRSETAQPLFWCTGNHYWISGSPSSLAFSICPPKKLVSSVRATYRLLFEGSLASPVKSNMYISFDASSCHFHAKKHIYCFLQKKKLTCCLIVKKQHRSLQWCTLYLNNSKKDANSWG